MNKNKVVAIVGADGKMGQSICEKLKSEFKIVKIEKDNSLENFFNDKIDLVIDFSVPSQSVATARFCKTKNIPLILGTTGQTKEQLDEIKLMGKHTKIVMSSNFSIGIFIVKQLLERLSVLLKTQHCEITIIEKHHREKLDSPSGTALMIKHEIEKLFRKNKFSFYT